MTTAMGKNNRDMDRASALLSIAADNIEQMLTAENLNLNTVDVCALTKAAIDVAAELGGTASRRHYINKAEVK